MPDVNTEEKEIKLEKLSEMCTYPSMRNVCWIQVLHFVLNSPECKLKKVLKLYFEENKIKVQAISIKFACTFYILLLGWVNYE